MDRPPKSYHCYWPIINGHILLSCMDIRVYDKRINFTTLDEVDMPEQFYISDLGGYFTWRAEIHSKK